MTTTLENNGGTDKWTSVTAIEYEPQTSGCLDLPREINLTLDRVTPNQLPVPRKVRFTKDGSLCRHKTQTVEPDSDKYRVVTTYGYDSFGNVNSTTVDALNLHPQIRVSISPCRHARDAIYWGSAGWRPEAITNAFNV